MTNSTREIEQVYSDMFDTGCIVPKFVLTGSDGEDDTFAERIMIYRDGDDNNLSELNRIDHGWFKLHYDFEAFLEDYSLIHRLRGEVLSLKGYLFKLVRETKAPKKIGDIEQQIVDLSGRDFGRLFRRIAKTRAAKMANKRAA